MSMIMMGLTASDPTEALKIIHQLECTDNNKQVMHESFMATDPRINQYSHLSCMHLNLNRIFH